MIKKYYRLTKPGIIYGNAITTIAGFLMASKWHGNLGLLVAALAGISIVIASACVCNNYIDRDIDDKMERTKNRALVKKLIPVKNALIFASVLGLLGFLILIIYTNPLTTFLAFTGFFFYVVLYSIWKRRSLYGTVVGSVAGAVPPVVGYCAVTNRFDMGALLLFLLLVFWQMPHFYAIAIFRLKEYTAASIPVLPVIQGIRTTKIQMLLYILAFILTTVLLTIFGFTGYVYLAVMVLLGLGWLGLCIKGFNTNNNTRWARKMFIFSLVIIILFSLMIAIDVTRGGK